MMGAFVDPFRKPPLAGGGWSERICSGGFAEADAFGYRWNVALLAILADACAQKVFLGLRAALLVELEHCFAVAPVFGCDGGFLLHDVHPWLEDAAILNSVT
ncbi:hypothetical protein ACQZ4Q_01390 [Agrobacterium vitis]